MCKHRTIDDFRTKIGAGKPFQLVRGPTAAPEYECSVCGLRFTWGPESSYFGTMECPKCWLPKVEAVVCSEACRKKHEERKKEKRVTDQEGTIEPALMTPPPAFEGPLPEKARALAAPDKNVARIVAKHVSRPRDPYVTEWNWASEVGDPCIRRIAYHRLYPERAISVDEEMAFLFKHGHYIEQECSDELKAAGYEIVENQRPFVDKKLKVKGKIDGKVVIHFENDRRRVPIEIKGYAPGTWKEMETAKDFIDSERPYLKKVPAQVTLYMMLDEAVTGGETVSILYLKNKLSGAPKQIVVPLEQGYAMWLWRRIRVVNDHVRRKKLPPRIPFEENVCGRCPFRATCLQEMPAGPSPVVLDPEKMSDLMDLLAEREKLAYKAKVYEEIDDKIKAIVTGHPKIIVGDWIITGREVKNPRVDVKSLPEEIKKQYTKENPYWRKTIVNVKKPQERED